MSLQLWMPFIRDIKQQGLANVQPTQTSGYTQISEGKLGKCYKFTSVFDTLLPLSNWDWTTGSVSFGAWVKISKTELATLVNAQTYDSSNQTAGGTLLGRNSYGGFALRWKTNSIYTDGSLNNVYIYAHLRNTSSSINTTSVYTIPFDTWFHAMLVLNRGTSKIELYVNGQMVSSTSLTVTGTFNTGTFLISQASWDGGNGRSISGCWQINDVRVYNDALSENEIKRLAKGLVLHYPLDNNGWGQENLLHNTFDFTGRNASNTTIVTDSVDGTYAKTTPSAVDWTYIQLGPTFAASLISGKTITVTCEVRAFDLPTSNTTNYCFLTLNAFNSASSFSRTGNKDHSYASNVLKEGEWITLSYQLDVNFSNWTVGSGYTTSDFQYITLGLYNHSGKRIDFRHPKIELGSIATPWCPNSSDSIATTLGVNGTTEYDISGYKYNGVKSGTLTYTSDTPKYWASTHIGSTSAKILIENIYTSGFGNSYSFAWWGRRASNSPMFWGFSNGVRLNGMLNGNLWNTGDSLQNPLYTIGTTTQVTAPSVNVWHHYVMTGDGTKCYVYLDGQLWAEAKTYKSISGTTIYINGWDSSTSYCSSDTNIADFRIYATALSAEDVAELYNSNHLD